MLQAHVSPKLLHGKWNGFMFFHGLLLLLFPVISLLTMGKCGY